MEAIKRLAGAVADMVRIKDHARPRLTALEIFKYVGPGLLVTVGFIDPGNWASNVAAGSDFGYTLLWMVTLSTVMLIILQHNAAHLGIATGLCLSEAAVKHLPRPVAVSALGTAVAAAVSTALAELLGGAIALRMLFGLPLALGTCLTLAVVLWMLFSKSYRRLEKYIIGFVSLIGLSFVFELSLVHIDWGQAVSGWVTPRLPEGSLPVVMSVLGAVVMPHNLFLHSEVIQSRQWNLDSPEMIRRQLKYEYLDTLFSMLVGFCINSAMILLAAAAFFSHGLSVSALDQAKELLSPMVGPAAGLVFAVSLMLAGVASSVTAGMAGGSIFAGIFGEPYDIHDSHSRLGVVITLVGAAVAILFVNDPLTGLIWSQIALSIQLPVTILLQIGLTSRRSVMGPYVNRPFTTVVLAVVAAVVIGLNVMLLVDTLG
ncbi:Nramp family divalent metal transporter [Solidesulfovibrio sp.]|uniref:Nramp family divalent metal transporter n=1 Tax=Solidesulfovibrio sp. TaxID=2910990 RepID=UPI002B1F8C92|nr:Nramp family divalent metal transporter [Solidesulfovibrio sp.]MEA4857812.1 Nramp family divalent metal transporter [Solidesulfovibrio sp.]